MGVVTALMIARKSANAKSPKWNCQDARRWQSPTSLSGQSLVDLSAMVEDAPD